MAAARLHPSEFQIGAGGAWGACEKRVLIPRLLQNVDAQACACSWHGGSPSRPLGRHISGGATQYTVRVVRAVTSILNKVSRWVDSPESKKSWPPLQHKITTGLE